MKIALLKRKMSDGAYEEFRLSQPVTTLGRSKTNDIVISDTGISRLHIRIENRNGNFFVLDNNSSNGTYVNKRKITEKLLEDGDLILLGRVKFHFEEREVADISLNAIVDDLEFELPPTIAGREDPPTVPNMPKPKIKPDETPYLPLAAVQNARAVEESGTDEYQVQQPIGATADLPVQTQESPVLPPPIPGTPMMTKAPERPNTGQGRPASSKIPSVGPSGYTSAGPTTDFQTNAQTATPAGHAKRLGAVLIDAVLHTMLLMPGMLLSVLGMGMVGTLLAVLGFMAGIAHFMIGWLKFGKTLGKHLLGLRIVDVRHPDQIELEAIIVVKRVIAGGLCAIPLFLPFLTILIHAEHQGLHDLFAGTQVIEEP